MLKAAIFDMDGLLIDSEPFWRESHITALAKYDRQITQNDVRQMAGRRTDEVVEHWRSTHNLEHVSGDKLEKEIVDAVIASVERHGETLPGVMQVIDLLAKHEIPMAVASSSAQHIIDAVLAKLDLTDHFVLTYSAKNEEFGKPHPGVFLTTAQKLGVHPSQCLVFEDAISGVTAAKAAGMRCIAIPEPANAGKSEYQIADLQLESLEQVTWQTIEQLFT